MANFDQLKARACDIQKLLKQETNPISSCVVSRYNFLVLQRPKCETFGST